MLAEPMDQHRAIGISGQQFGGIVDIGALDLFLDNLDPSVVGQAGSSLAHTIKQGVDLLSLSNSRFRTGSGLPR